MPDNSDNAAQGAATAPAAAPAAAAPTAPAKAVATKQVRVLVAHEEHLPNHVITLSAKEAAAAVKDGWADDSDDAVAYALENEPQPEAAA